MSRETSSAHAPPVASEMAIATDAATRRAVQLVAVFVIIVVGFAVFVLDRIYRINRIDSEIRGQTL